MRFLIIISLHLIATVCFGQPKTYTTANAHSHNDYVNPIPFYLAYNNEFGSIEADIYPVNGTLVVAHSKNEIQSDRTLRKLYIDPLLHVFDSAKPRKLNLLIDVKDDYKTSLTLLIKEISPLIRYLTTTHKRKYITISISGNRPPPQEYKNYPEYVFFDDDLKLPHNKEEWRRVSLVSLPLYSVTRWNGIGNLDKGDSLRLKKLIDSVHSAGKPIRFWAAPDTEQSWYLQAKVGVDLIGTDKIVELSEFLLKKLYKH